MNYFKVVSFIKIVQYPESILFSTKEEALDFKLNLEVQLKIYFLNAAPDEQQQTKKSYILMI